MLSAFWITWGCGFVNPNSLRRSLVNPLPARLSGSRQKLQFFSRFGVDFCEHRMALWRNNSGRGSEGRNGTEARAVLRTPSPCRTSSSSAGLAWQTSPGFDSLKFLHGGVTPSDLFRSAREPRKQVVRFGYAAVLSRRLKQVSGLSFRDCYPSGEPRLTKQPGFGIFASPKSIIFYGWLK